MSPSATEHIPLDPPSPGGRVAVALSGGVDSAVAACLLARGGRDVVAFFLRNGVTAEGGGAARSCCSVSDAADARRVAHRLGIPFYSLDVEAPFQKIIEGFVSAYRSGRTPNPCVECNSGVKFGRLVELARRIGAESVATGHYARVRREAGRVVLSKGADRTKDQSYVLSMLTQQQLERAEFPLGDLTKDQVRRIAQEADLPVADKPESQEICFVPTGDYRDLLERDGGADAPGEIVTTRGEIVGRHRGISGFTVGQRRGLGVARGVPQYVVRIDAASRRVVIGDRDEARGTAFVLRGVNWVKLPEPDPGAAFAVSARVRHRHVEARARAVALCDGRVEVSFAEPQFAIAPGQTAVLYDGDDVLAAGVIDNLLEPR